MMTAVSGQSLISLSTLLEGLVVTTANTEIGIGGLCLDNRKLKAGDAFFALKGTAQNGLTFAHSAITQGAAAVLHETPADEVLQQLALRHGVLLIHDTQLRKNLGLIASRFYHEPSKSMRTIGVTGTDGKTSLCHFIAQCLARLGAADDKTCGVIGTLGNGLYGELGPAGLTTPDAVSLQALLADIRDKGASYVAMEASSHGIDQQRINGVDMDVAVLTNIGRDHLDYHKNFNAYKAAKRQLFMIPSLTTGIVNYNDQLGQELLADASIKYPLRAFGLSEERDSGFKLMNRQLEDWVLGRDLQFDDNGFDLEVVTPDSVRRIKCGLLGRFNVSNVLTVIAVLRSLGFEYADLIAAVEALQSVTGRMQPVHRPGWPVAVVDYAHTPQALGAALQAVRQHFSGKLWCVFGCGGDRDRGKRAQMGSIAEQYADYVILTDDNPRHEAAEEITDAIALGMRSSAMCVHDRAEAIRAALHTAEPGDCVLVAGKGHEDYQQFGDDRVEFNDRVVIERIMQEGQ